MTGLALVTDFLGIDTRTGNGGLGNWDGTTGTPTYMTLTLSGLGTGIYNWTSFHHDTEHVHGDFAVWVDTGSGFVHLADGVSTPHSPPELRRDVGLELLRELPRSTAVRGIR